MPALVLPIAAATVLAVAFVYFVTRLDKSDETGKSPSRFVVIAAGTMIILMLVVTHGLDSEAVGDPRWDIFIRTLGVYAVAGIIFAVITKRWPGPKVEGSWEHAARTRPTSWKKPYPAMINWRWVPWFVVFAGFALITHHMRRNDLTVADFLRDFMN